MFMITRLSTVLFILQTTLKIADIGNYGLIDKDTPQEVYTKVCVK